MYAPVHRQCTSALQTISYTSVHTSVHDTHVNALTLRVNAYQSAYRMCTVVNSNEDNKDGDADADDDDDNDDADADDDANNDDANDDDENNDTDDDDMSCM